MKLKGASVGRTLDHSRIKNFLKCNETSGTKVYLENGKYLEDAALGFTSNLGGGVVFNTNQSITLTGGNWDTINPVDCIMMALFRQDGGTLGLKAVNWIWGNSPQQDYHFGGSTSGGANGAAVGELGASTTQEVTTGNLIPMEENYRLAWKCSYGEKWEKSVVAAGNDVSFEAPTIIGSEQDDWLSSGSVLDMTNGWIMALTADASMTFHGLVIVEFPNGFPNDIDERINNTFTQWEAGNKVHFPVYEDE